MSDNLRRDIAQIVGQTSQTALQHILVQFGDMDLDIREVGTTCR